MKSNVHYCTYLVLVILLLLLNVADAYRSGDIVRVSKKSATKLAQSQWSEIMGKYSPRYTWKRSIKLPILDEEQFSPQSNLKEFKIMLSFDHDRFITPYFSVIDSKGVFLESMDFTFVYLGDDIVDMKWEAHYNEHEKQKHPPTFVTLNYAWEEFSEKDVTVSMSLLLFSGFIIGSVTITYVVLDSQMKSESHQSMVAHYQDKRRNTASYREEPTSVVQSAPSLIHRTVHNASQPVTSSLDSVPVYAYNTPAQKSSHPVNIATHTQSTFTEETQPEEVETPQLSNAVGFEEITQEDIPPNVEDDKSL